MNLPEDATSWWLPDGPPPRCNVCEGDSGGAYAGVACCCLGAVSLAYCDRCLSNQAEPAGVLQGIITDAGGLESLADWVRDLTTWYGGAYVSVVDFAYQRGERL